MLDNIDYKGGGEADPADVGHGGYEARISRSQLQWLAEELKHVEQERLVFIATHAPLGSENGSYATDNRESFSLASGAP